MKKPTTQPESDLPKIGAPAQRALATVGVYRLTDLTKFTEKEILKLHGMGPKAFEILLRALEENGLAFKS